LKLELAQEAKIPFLIYAESSAFLWTSGQKCLKFSPSLGAGFSGSAETLEPRRNHGEGDGLVTIQGDLDEAFAGFVFTRITLLFACSSGKRAECINRANIRDRG